MTNKVAIVLDEQQARLFLLLMKAHAWDIRSGSIEVHFDDLGMPVKTKTTSYTTPD